uniref:Uncharacterized protein n=1 Tax=Magallana gigas TaxID=29159 RepID=A0A8W8IBI3_MAGGI
MDLPTPTPFLILSPNELSSENDKLPPSGRRNWNLKPKNASGLSNAEQNFPGIQQVNVGNVNPYSLHTVGYR